MQEKNNNHHTLFITLIIAYFVLLIVALAKIHSYGAELGFYESEVSGNEEIYEGITENSEEGASVSSDEAVKKNIQDDEIILVPSVESIELESTIEEDSMSLMSVAPTSYIPSDGDVVIESITFSGHRINNNEVQIHSSSSCKYVKLESGHIYTIYSTSTPVLGYTINSSHIPVTSYTEETISPEQTSYLFVSSSNSIFAVYNEYSGGNDDPSGNDPSGNDPDPSGNDPSGNDPSGNNPSGGGIELDGDLQEYLINYFGHKDYTVYDSEETFKGKKFFVSRYEYEVLKSLDDIKILLLCNVGILIVILFVGRRKRNAGS